MELSDPKVLEQIQDETEFESTPGERILFYKSRHFVPIAVTYLSKWAALTSVCGEYVVASERARRSVLDHIRESPNAEEAGKLIDPLKRRLMNELREDAAEANLNIGALQSDAAEVNLDITALNAELAQLEAAGEGRRVS